MYLENIVMDAAEPQRLGRFWEAALDGERLTGNAATQQVVRPAGRLA